MAASQILRGRIRGARYNRSVEYAKSSLTPPLSILFPKIPSSHFATAHFPGHQPVLGPTCCNFGAEARIPLPNYCNQNRFTCDTHSSGAEYDQNLLLTPVARSTDPASRTTPTRHASCVTPKEPFDTPHHTTDPLTLPVTRSLRGSGISVT